LSNCLVMAGAGCVEINGFREAIADIESWRQRLDEVRPHSILASLQPHELMPQSEHSAASRAGGVLPQNPELPGSPAGQPLVERIWSMQTPRPTNGPLNQRFSTHHTGNGRTRTGWRAEGSCRRFQRRVHGSASVDAASGVNRLSGARPRMVGERRTWFGHDPVDGPSFVGIVLASVGRLALGPESRTPTCDAGSWTGPGPTFVAGGLSK
jgi:hypothetical protein